MIKKLIGFIGKNKSLLLWVFFLSVYLTLVLPITTFTLYRSEFTFGSLELLLSTIFLTFILTATLFIIFRNFKKDGQYIAGVLCVFLAGFLFYNFYFSDYGGKVIGADTDVFQSNYTALEYLLMIVSGGGLFWFRKSLGPHLPAIFGIFIFANIGNSFSLFQQTDSHHLNEEPKSHPERADDFFSFSPDRNIIHIVLDGMQGTVFSEILEKNPDLKKSLSGFVFYPDALTPSDITFLSMSSVLSAEPFNGEGLISRYLKHTGVVDDPTIEEQRLPPLLSILNDEGFTLDVFSAPGGGMKEKAAYRTYYHTDLEIAGSLSGGPKKLVDFTLVRILPWKWCMVFFA